jgi:ABC-type transport system involved in multi-copper enzyme maturation permease subunit
MRAAARQPFTYSARVCGAAVLLGIAMFFGLQDTGAKSAGGQLFFLLNRMLSIALWVLVPLMTADCISRERRDGTLPLLFLTPLRAYEIVLAKSIAQGLRAFTLWLSVVPVLMIPLLLGGVSWLEATVSALLNFGSLCVALGAGIMASSFSKVWHRAILGALMLATAAFLVLAAVAGFFFLAYGTARVGWPGSVDYGLALGIAILAGPSRDWLMRLSPTPLLIAASHVAAFALLVLTLAIIVASQRVRRNWQEQPRSALTLKLESIFCTPVVWRNLFQKWMRRKLERNPIGWLEQRTWSGRLIMWSLLAVMVSFYSVLLGQTGFTRSLNSLQYFLGWLTLGSLAMSAAGSFRRERESGVLELLLVSPLKEWEIIKGRVRGLWAQYAPAMALFVFVWLYVATLTTRGEGVLGPVIYFSATFVLLPIVGLYFSLAKDGFIGALVGTVLIAGIFPFIVPRLLELAVMLLAFLVGMDLSVAWARALLRYEWVNVPLFLTLTVQFALAWRFAHRLHSNLRQRRFKLDRKMN